ncbi:hypothetical protein MN608_06366 [Microdochium nivale]|nr:hypothetical protein MN608_06366 [Microdochium nivale]
MSGSVGPNGLHPAFFVLSWVFFSNLTILFNKWLIDSVGFRYRMSDLLEQASWLPGSDIS